MGRYTGPVCKLCRREGQKLFLKGPKCYTEKCPVDRRTYPPGQHGPAQARRRKQSEYAGQLREKQKVKRIYGLQEKQFRNLFERAVKQPGVTGANLLVNLETRLDDGYSILKIPKKGLVLSQKRDCLYGRADNNKLL